ncbi:MFS transporter [Deferrisoma camini]|uniref:MFS transporter n=1 Tax=Deferrisoma camini TaxID=1035120 RepID=UPI00046CF0B9|nr:MFS transporter [Deferrisoma camini]
MGRRVLSRPRLPGTVRALGWVSLLTDLSSEMIYPLLPAFLTGVLGAGAGALGVIEGVAEATASVLKWVSGRWSDRMERRKPLVLVGYTVSGMSRPLIGAASSWLGVLGLRFSDRVGKGLRTSPRDALIAEAVAPEQRGRAFGFHRAMDHAGAVVGPLVAAALLGWGVPLRVVFGLAALPAAAVVVVIARGVAESPRSAPQPDPSLAAAPKPGGFGPGFGRFLLALAVFTLGNSTDAFLLFRMSELGAPAASVAVLWAAHHGVKTAATLWGGRIVDRLGPRRCLTAGWLWYAVVYLGFALARGPGAGVVWFLAYGLYHGLAEPAERAWTAALAPRGVRGAAYGWVHGAMGLAALPASLLFGGLWEAWGAPVAFGVGAALAVGAAALLAGVPSRPVGGANA